MKKLLLVLVIVILTGCVSNSDFNKTCSYSIESAHIKENRSMYVTYNNKDVLNKAVVTRSYEALDDRGTELISEIKEAADSYNKRYGGMNIKINVSKDTDNEYEISYDVDVQNVEKSVLEEFMLKKNSIKFFNKMREKNIDCED